MTSLLKSALRWYRTPLRKFALLGALLAEKTPKKSALHRHDVNVVLLCKGKKALTGVSDGTVASTKSVGGVSQSSVVSSTWVSHR